MNGPAWAGLRRRHLLGAAAGAIGPARPLVWAATEAATEAATDTKSDDSSQPPAPQPVQPWRPPPVFEQRLANGLTVLTVPRPGLPLVSAQLLLRVGAEADPSGQPGVAAMTATLLAKGARRQGQDLGAVALARQVEALGGTLDSGSGWHRSSLAITVTTPQLPAALALLCDMLRQPLLSAPELDRARAQALDQWALTMASAEELAGLLLRRVVWGPSGYGRLATAAALRRLTRRPLQQFHARHYWPEQSALVLAGDITPRTALRLAHGMLGDWRAAAAPTPAVPMPALPPAHAPSLAPALWLLHLPGNSQCAVTLAAPSAGDPSTDPDDAWPVGLVSNAVLGGGYSARLNQAIRIRRGLSYGAFSSVQSLPLGGLFSASAMTRPASAAQVLQLMRDELNRLASSAPPAAELAARQANLLGSLARRLDTSSGLAGWVGEQWLRARPLHQLAEQAERILAVSPAQVQGFAARHWADGGLDAGTGRQRAVVAGDILGGGTAWDTVAARRLSLAELDLDRLGLVAAR